MAGRERRHTGQVAAGLRLTRANGRGQIAGYAAVFYDGSPGSQFTLGPDYVERILPGAFRDAAGRDDVRGLFNHDPNNVLGRTPKTMDLVEDDRGLFYRIDPPDTELGRSVAELVRRGDVTGSSFGFAVEDDEMRQEGRTLVREIRKVRLFDVGPVTFPAYEGTTSGVRAQDLAGAMARRAEFLRGAPKTPTGRGRGDAPPPGRSCLPGRLRRRGGPRGRAPPGRGAGPATPSRSHSRTC